MELEGGLFARSVEVDDPQRARWAAAEAVDEWQRLDQLTAAADAANARHERARWWSRRSRRAALVQALGEAEESSRCCTRLASELERFGAGSGGVWGALSTIERSRRWGQLSLEATLGQYRQALPDEPVRSLRQALPTLRAHLELGHIGQEVLDDLHEQLLALAAGADDQVAAALHEHLPGELRPLPASVEGLRRVNEHLTLYVDQPGTFRWVWQDAVDQGRERGLVPPDAIELHDIVVHGKGRGLGSALLVQLSRLADRDGLVIYGDIVPGHTQPEEDMVRLSSWYVRHGFHHNINPNLPPERWRKGATIVRDPA